MAEPYHYQASKLSSVKLLAQVTEPYIKWEETGVGDVEPLMRDTSGRESLLRYIYFMGKYRFSQFSTGTVIRVLYIMGNIMWQPPDINLVAQIFFYLGKVFRFI